MSALDTAEFLRDFHMSGRIPDYEEVLAFSYRKFLSSGMNVIDIGAHAGRHTLQFLDIIGTEGFVWAFEPLPPFAEALERDLAGLKRVKIIQMALSDSERVSCFKYVENYPGESGLQERNYNYDGAIIRDIEVRVSSLDIYFADNEKNVDFVKIDVEGGEIDILRGATQFFKKNRPIVSIEYGRPSYQPYGNTSDTLFISASTHDYLISDLFGNIIENIDDWRVICDTAYWDYFLVPVERRTEWADVFGMIKFPDDYPL